MVQVSNYDLVVFDFEDVLIDRSAARCAAVSKAVDVYLVSLLGVRDEGGPVFTPKEVEEVARAQGLERDADLMEAMLIAALHWLPEEVNEADFQDYDGRDLLDAVKASGRIKASLGDIGARKNISEFNKVLRQRGGGAKAISRLRNLRNRFLALTEGHILMDNFGKRIYMEVYLGSELFSHLYGQEPRFVVSEGTIALESLWIEPEDLGHLRKRFAMAGVTSRPQVEVQKVLAQLGVQNLFEVVVGRGAMGMGMGDPEEALLIRSLGVVDAQEADYGTKVTEAIERARAMDETQSYARIAYVGNCAPEDRNFTTLKERYRVVLIGCVFGRNHKTLAQMKEKGADYVVSEPKQLVKLLSERPKTRPITIL